MKTNRYEIVSYDKEWDEYTVKEASTMKTFQCEISLNAVIHPINVIPVNISYHKAFGETEAEYDLELIDITDIPASCFTEPVKFIALQQARNDAWLNADIASYLRVDRFADELDMAYEAHREASNA